MPASNTTAARIAANRHNAQKSTGPKTPEGKERSRANAVKHGLTGAGIALPGEDSREVESRFMAVQSEMAPQTVVGSFLAHRIALMTVRCQRAARQETASLATRIRRAAADFDEARNSEADHLLSWIMAEPSTHRAKLMAMPEGVDRLIAGLLALRNELDQPGTVSWDYVHTDKVEAYFGRRGSDLPHSRGLVLANAIRGNFEEIKPEEVEHLATDPEKRNWACDEMTVYLDAEVARLRAHRETLNQGAIALDRAEAGDRAMFDPGKEATLARRYEAAAAREFYKALREFAKVEAEASGEPELETLTPTQAERAPLVEDDAPIAARADAEPLDRDGIQFEPKANLGNRFDSPLGSFGKEVPDMLGPLDRGFPADLFDSTQPEAIGTNSIGSPVRQGPDRSGKINKPSARLQVSRSS